jgi:hypothetical protein
MTFDDAQDAFYVLQSNETAGTYLETANTYFSDEMIGDDTMIAVVSEVSRWLLGKPLLGH